VDFPSNAVVNAFAFTLLENRRMPLRQPSRPLPFACFGYRGGTVNLVACGGLAPTNQGE
jgi:hypothetical protein